LIGVERLGLLRLRHRRRPRYLPLKFPDQLPASFQGRPVLRLILGLADTGFQVVLPELRMCNTAPQLRSFPIAR
jgi:hypothetical protein